MKLSDNLYSVNKACPFKTSPDEDCRPCTYLEFDQVDILRNKHRTIIYNIVGCRLNFPVCITKTEKPYRLL